MGYDIFLLIYGTAVLGSLFGIAIVNYLVMRFRNRKNSEDLGYHTWGPWDEQEEEEK